MKNTPSFYFRRDFLRETFIRIMNQYKEKPIAISIDGKWGVGKTHFWKNELAPLIGAQLEKYPIYTSVFGKKDGNEIIQDLVAQFLERENKVNNKLKSVLGILSTFIKLKTTINIDTTFLFKMLDKKDLRNTIICIDDFERLSDKIPPQDILGLISELKENKGCWVVILYNDDELFQSKETNEKRNLFNKYKEKVFDHHLSFSINPYEQFLLLKNHEPSLKDLHYDFDSHIYLPKILDIMLLLEQQSYIDLRTLNKAICSYRLCLQHLNLQEHINQDFKKTSHYLLYSLIHAHYFSLENNYFEELDYGHGIGITGLLNPHTSIYRLLLKSFLPILKNVLMLADKTSNYCLLPSSLMSPSTPLPSKESFRNYFENFIKKIISDTEFHNKYKEDLQKTNNDNKQASINFFLNHKDNIIAIPYMFGFRILDYAFEEENDVFSMENRKKSFALEIVLQKYQDDMLTLFNQWCDEAYTVIVDKHNRDEGEYFWINSMTFFKPLESLFKELNIDKPQNQLCKNLDL